MDGTGTEVAPILLLVAQWYRGTGAVRCMKQMKLMNCRGPMYGCSVISRYSTFDDDKETTFSAGEAELHINHSLCLRSYVASILPHSAKRGHTRP
jgi:hypothetical protein